MKIKVSLDNGCGELDSKTFGITEGGSDDEGAISDRVKKILADWILSEGDTITIREVA